MDEKVSIVGLHFPSFYFKGFDAAIEFYTQVFGPPQNEDPRIKGWRLGVPWLTFSLAEDMGTDPNGNPRNAEFAIQVATPEEVDRLYNAFIQTGAKPYMQPKDTQMYNRMRYCEMIRLEFG